MKFNLLCKCAIIGALVFASTVLVRASDKKIIESVKAMEKELDVKISGRFDLDSRIRLTQQIPVTYNHFGSAFSSEGTAIAWSASPIFDQRDKQSFLMVKSLKGGIQTVKFEGQLTGGLAISSEAEVIVAIRNSLNPSSRRRELIAIDRRSGLVVYDLTAFVSQADLGNNLEDICVSAQGTLLAICSFEQTQVIEIPSGKTVYFGPGSFPRLSPDGKRLAFVHKGEIWIHSFAEGSTVQLLKGKRVKGIGGWSPDGRFLLAGAWTTLLALEKRQIVVDTATSEYAVIGKLSDGDYGNNFAWVSVKLLER